MRENLQDILRQSGSAIMNYFGSAEFTLKDDASPVTKADRASHALLTSSLKRLKNIPVLSEENILEYGVRKNWYEFWLIDPLDGTKEFINGDKDFCISVALINQNSPIVGAIYAPALDEFFYAERAKIFSYEGPRRNVFHQNSYNTKVAVSRFHHSEKTKKFLSDHKLNSLESIGSALKFCRLAMGEIDLYPRFEGSKEWDIAAGHLILKESGGSIIDLKTKTEPVYNKPLLENNFFISSRKGIAVERFLEDSHI